MSATQILGAVVFGVGVILLVFGFQGTEAPVDQISNTLTGRYTQSTMWYLGLGVAAAIGGALLVLSGRRR